MTLFILIALMLQALVNIYFVRLFKEQRKFVTQLQLIVHDRLLKDE